MESVLRDEGSPMSSVALRDRLDDCLLVTLGFLASVACFATRGRAKARQHQDYTVGPAVDDQVVGGARDARAAGQLAVLGQ